MNTSSSSPSSSTTTAAQQLLQKLFEQQQSPKEEDKPQPLYSPLILLQYSCHVSQRVAAATRTTSSSSTKARTKAQQQQQRQMAKVQAEADLYRRAQLRTPDENAQRLIWGGALWLEYLTKLMIQEQRKQQQKLVWISTSTRPTPLWLQEEAFSNVHIINSTEVYSNALDDDDDAPHPLASLLTQIRQHCCNTSATTENPGDDNKTSIHCTSIVIESLSPWIQLFGFSTVYQFVQALLVLPHTLLLIPVLTETLSTTQHQELEDLSHTCLWLSNHTGQVDLHVLRHGIREHDNRVREIWDFTLLQNNEDNTPTTSIPFRLSVGTVGAGAEETEDQDETPPDQVNLVEAMNPALTTANTAPRPVPAAVKEANAGGDTAAAGLQEVTQRTKKISLKFEAEDAPRKVVAANSTGKTAPPTTGAPNKFNVFVQDDDPEYEDYDSDDPDDDLDI